MKASLIVVLVVSLLGTSMLVAGQQEMGESGTDFEGDFFQGMESGFFLRDTVNGHHEYDCPDPVSHQDLLKKINGVLQPVTMLLGLAENEMLTTLLRSMTTIVDSVFAIIGAVDGYRGSEFCSGLLFGISGSNLILSLGKDIMAQMENFDQMFSKTIVKKTRAQRNK